MREANTGTPLHRIRNGCWALVTALAADGPARRRLLDLGLVPGTKVEVIRRSPLGDPIAFNIRGAVIAFRKEEAEQVLVVQVAQ